MTEPADLRAAAQAYIADAKQRRAQVDAKHAQLQQEFKDLCVTVCEVIGLEAAVYNGKEWSPGYHQISVNAYLIYGADGATACIGWDPDSSASSVGIRSLTAPTTVFRMRSDVDSIIKAVVDVLYGTFNAPSGVRAAAEADHAFDPWPPPHILPVPLDQLS